jgi:hypothetical protein
LSGILGTVKYSNGKFGFSVQKKIYLDELGGTKEYKEKIWNEFGDRVGWRKGGTWLSYSDFTFELLDTTPVAHLPFCVCGGGVVGFRLVVVGWFLFSRAKSGNL